MSLKTGEPPPRPAWPIVPSKAPLAAGSIVQKMPSASTAIARGPAPSSLKSTRSGSMNLEPRLARPIPTSSVQ
jgi:hypothetical protein